MKQIREDIQTGNLKPVYLFVSVMFSKCIAAETEVKAGYVESKKALEMLLSYLLR